MRTLESGLLHVVLPPALPRAPVTVESVVDERSRTDDSPETLLRRLNLLEEALAPLSLETGTC